MAEQSIGYATVGTGDGPLAGYDSTRMTNIEAKTLGIGVMLQGSLLALAGTGTATLAIADGSAIIATGTTSIVGGYLYENTSSASIAVGAVANGTYNLVILANESGSSVTVTRSVAGTTILTKTTRLAMATTAQLTTAAQPFITLGTVTVTSGLVATLTPYLQYATSRQNTTTQRVRATGGTCSAMVANTFTALTNYATSSNSADGSMQFTLANGNISLYQSGTYHFDFLLTYDINATGARGGGILGIASTPLVSAAFYATSSLYRGTFTADITVTLGTPQTFYLEAFSTVVNRFVTDSSITVTRL